MTDYVPPAGDDDESEDIQPQLQPGQSGINHTPLGAPLAVQLCPFCSDAVIACFHCQDFTPYNPEATRGGCRLHEKSVNRYDWCKGFKCRALLD